MIVSIKLKNGGVLITNLRHTSFTIDADKQIKAILPCGLIYEIDQDFKDFETVISSVIEHDVKRVLDI